MNAIRDYGCGYDHDKDKDQHLPLYPSSSLSYVPSKPCLTRKPLYDSDNDISEDSGQDAYTRSGQDADSNNDGIVT